MTDEEYIDWSVNLFKGFDKLVRRNGCVLYNLSYSAENASLMYLVVAEIIKQTNFCLADTIIWKKKSALPNNTSPNKLTRICEFVFVFCRKDEFATFDCNKEAVNKTSNNGQVIYENIFNFLEAPNNDGSCPIHKATYSTTLCRKLLRIYAKEGALVYDPFMGTGTTAVACFMEKMNWVGTEISPRYCEYANNRIKQETAQLTLF